MQIVDKKISKTEIIKIALIEFKLHPKATHSDYYKLFFQSYYGPGHSIKNTEIAYKYFLDELRDSTHFDSVLMQDIGNSFYRVNLKLIKENYISAEDLFSSFINSQKQEPDFEEWFDFWHRIQKILVSIPEIKCKKDSEKLEVILTKNKLISHSKIFKGNYNPHYRIIQKKYFPVELYNFL